MSRAPFAFGLKSGVSSPPSYHLPARAAKVDRREGETPARLLGTPARLLAGRCRGREGELSLA
jgi:hypothetical protein